MITSLYAKAIVLVILAARHAPLSASSRLDGLALTMIAASRHLPPMPRKSARLGAPYIGQIFCPECSKVYQVFMPEGAELPPDPFEKVTVDCPSCEGIEAEIL